MLFSQQVKEAVNESILCWYHVIMEKMPSSTTTTTPSGGQHESLNIDNFNILVGLVMSDLTTGSSQKLQDMFKQQLGIDYCQIAFSIYDREVRAI